MMKRVNQEGDWNYHLRPMETKKKIIIFDLDGTLANIEHRRHFVTAPENPSIELMGTWKPDWDAFYKACVDDTVNEAVAYIFKSLWYSENKIYIWSGREVSVWVETWNWIMANIVHKYGLHTASGDILKMREPKDYTPDDELKEKWLMEVGVENVLMVFDDRDKVVKMWRSHGIPCFQVAEGNF